MKPDCKIFSRFGIIAAVLPLIFGLLLWPRDAQAQTGWQPQTLPALEAGVTYSLQDIKAVNGNEAWISGGLSNGKALVLKTLDGGTWNLMFRRGNGSPDPWQRFWTFGRLSVVDSNTAWAAGTFGLTAFTSDGGATWLHEGTPCNTGPGGTPQHNYGLKAVSAVDVWTVGWLSDQFRGLIWHRPYTGNCADWGWWPWRLEAQYGYATVLAIDACDASNAWAVGYPGIVHTADGGGTWITEVPAPRNLLKDVAAVSPTVAWAVGKVGLILKTVDGGGHWVEQGSGTLQNLQKISAVNAEVAWAVGDNGTILKTTDGGTTWRSQVSGISETFLLGNLIGVSAADVDTAWAISDQRIVLHVTDGGVYQPLSAPAVSGLSPAGGPIAGGTTPVFVGGRDFRPGARVLFGGIPAASVEFRSAWELLVTTPPHAAGIVDVTVINPDGPSGTAKKAFAYADTQPLIVRLNPSYGYQDTEAVLDISGAGLTPAQGTSDPVPTVNINGTAVAGRWADYSFVNVLLSRGLLPAAGMAEISVTTAAGTSNTLPFAVNPGWVPVERIYTPPYDRSVTIPSLSGPVQATFYGMNWGGSVRVGKVFEQPGWLGGSSPPPAGYSFLPGYYYDVATYGSLTYQAAMICLPYANEDVQGAGLEEPRLRMMRYLGNSASWEDITYTLDRDANVICGTTTGLATYFALAQGPQQTPPPVVAAIEPAIGPPAGGTTVTLSGRFPPNATVTFGGIAATNVTDRYGMRITAQIPAHTLGFVDVVVTGPDSQKTLVGGFEYVPPPTVVSVTPDRGGPDTPVTIKGTGFRGGNGGSMEFGGAGRSDYDWIDETTIQGYPPHHAAGPVDVVFINPDGQSGRLVNGFTYLPAPAVTDVQPNAGPVLGGTTLTITGTGFQPGATVTINDSLPATGVAVVNSTTITAVTPEWWGTETVAVRVVNPDFQSASLNSAFTYGKSPSIILWENPASIVFGTKIGATQLNATANVDGDFNYSPSTGTTLGIGTRMLWVMFTPTDTATYPTATKTVNLVVLPPPGDVNADTAVNVRDAILALQTMSARMPAPTVNIGADVDGDGAIGMEEVLFILQTAAQIR